MEDLTNVIENLERAHAALSEMSRADPENRRALVYASCSARAGWIVHTLTTLKQSEEREAAH